MSANDSFICVALNLATQMAEHISAHSLLTSTSSYSPEVIY